MVVLFEIFYNSHHQAAKTEVASLRAVLHMDLSLDRPKVVQLQLRYSLPQLGVIQVTPISYQLYRTETSGGLIT